MCYPSLRGKEILNLSESFPEKSLSIYLDR